MSSRTTAAASTTSDPIRWLEDHGDGLFAYAMMRVGKTEVAEDLVQETLVAAVSSRERYTGAASERTWLIAILRHRIADYYRQSVHRGASGAEPEQLEAFFTSRGLWKKGPGSWSLDPSKLAENEEFWEVLRICLSKVPRRVAEAFRLREIEHLESEVVCQVLGISANNLWTRLHRARLLLRHCLEENWFGPQARGQKK